MSDDDFSDPYDEPSMEISIETLTGTSFDMRVYPTDTVLDIKNKIQRVEGIPAHHQNLLFQLKELQDFKRLCDIGVVNGSKLKLVLSMRGGPISTRRMSCDHHIVWKDLKDLIEHTRDEIGEKTGSKVSVLVFKEGDVINLIRVIENEDGSYSPYADKTITPPYKTSDRDSAQGSFFKKISEDMEMASKMHTLKSKMQNLSVKRQMRDKAKTKSEGGVKPKSPPEFELPKRTLRSRFAYKLLNDKKFESKIAENEEHGEIALKDKHRTKKLSEKKKKFEQSSSKSDSDDVTPIVTRYKSRRSLYDNNKLLEEKLPEPIAILEEESSEKEILTSIEVPCAETLSLSARNRVHLTQFLLQDSDRMKSSSESLLEDSSQELWEIEHEPISKKSAAYPVNLVKRRASVDHSYDSDVNVEAANPDEFKKSDYELLGRNFYNVPQYVSAPSAIPPQYAPKNGRICAVYLGSPPQEKAHRSPLYGRRTRLSEDSEESSKETGTKRRTVSNIERLCNDYAEAESSSSSSTKSNELDDILGFYNSKSISELDKFLNLRQTKYRNVTTKRLEKKTEDFPDKIKIEAESLPSLNKKRMRCEHCNKRLNVTNIYNCRCGRMFCSQHRYSEVHDCKYDYKTEGRKILEQQNPLVTASKLPKF